MLFIYLVNVDISDGKAVGNVWRIQYLAKRCRASTLVGYLYRVTSFKVFVIKNWLLIGNGGLTNGELRLDASLVSATRRRGIICQYTIWEGNIGHFTLVTNLSLAFLHPDLELHGCGVTRRNETLETGRRAFHQFRASRVWQRPFDVSYRIAIKLGGAFNVFRTCRNFVFKGHIRSREAAVVLKCDLIGDYITRRR